MQKTVHNGCKENSRSVRAVIYDPLGTNDQLIASFSDFKHRVLGAVSWIWAKLDPQYCKSQQVALLFKVVCVCVLLTISLFSPISYQLISFAIHVKTIHAGDSLSLRDNSISQDKIFYLVLCNVKFQI